MRRLMKYALPSYCLVVLTVACFVVTSASHFARDGLQRRTPQDPLRPTWGVVYDRVAEP